MHAKVRTGKKRSSEFLGRLFSYEFNILKLKRNMSDFGFLNLKEVI